MPGEYYHFYSHSMTKTINLFRFMMKKALTKPKAIDLKASWMVLHQPLTLLLLLVIQKRAFSAGMSATEAGVFL